MNHKKNYTASCLFYLFASKVISTYVKLFFFFFTYVKLTAAIARLLVCITLEGKIIQLTEVITKAAGQLALPISFFLFFRLYIFSALSIYMNPYGNMFWKTPDTYKPHVCMIVLGMAAYVV